MTQTSLIPTVVALSNFFAHNFPHISWYPYWYLGNPYQFLIGPVVPLLLSIFNFQFLIFNFYLGLILASFLIGAFGIYLLLKDFGVGKKEAVLPGLLYILLPAGLFLLQFQNGLNHIALGSLPYIFLLYKRFLEKDRLETPVFLSIAIAFVLLIDISILLPLAIGFMALFISLDIKKQVDGKIVNTLLIYLLAISLSTLWYTPRFWWVVLSNPSFGGAPLSNVLLSLLKLLLNLLPLVLALLVVKMTKFRPAGYLLFAMIFFVSFLFLTIVRFLSDPDFVMDWIGFGLELQFALAIILGSTISNIIRQLANQKSKILIITASLVILFVSGWILVFREWSINSDNEYQQRIISLLKHVGSNERVFLSGSSVFWINSSLDVPQVRGGVDQGSIHPFWAHGAYQIREGENSLLSHDWLLALGTSYVLVHEEGSDESLFDFKKPSKFFSKEALSYFQLVAQKKEDKLYKVQGGVGIGRIADISILTLSRPRGGADSQVLNQYASRLKRKISSFSFERPNKIVVSGNLLKDEVLSLAITYDASWGITEGQGIIVSDSLGNIVILPKKTGLQRFVLVFKSSFWDFLAPLILILITGLFIVTYKTVFPFAKKKLPNFYLGLHDED